MDFNNLIKRLDKLEAKKRDLYFDIRKIAERENNKDVLAVIDAAGENGMQTCHDLGIDITKYPGYEQENEFAWGSLGDSIQALCGRDDKRASKINDWFKKNTGEYAY